MDYGSLIGRSWYLTWHHRFLWVLGLFATSTVGSCSPTSAGNGFQWRSDSFDATGFYTPELGQALQQVDPFLSRNIALFFIGVVALVLLAALAFFIVSIIAQGGMTKATANLALGRPIGARDAWAAGLRMFWRYLLMWLLLFGLGIVLALALAAVLAVLFVVGSSLEGAVRVAMIVLGGLAGILTLLVAVPFFIVTSVVVAFAQRAISVEGVGPWMALQVGYRLVRRGIGTSALVWLISLGLSIGVGIVVVLAIVVLLVPLGAVGAGLYAVGGLSTALLLYGIAGAIALLAGIWFLAGVANTFFWNYWTLTYLYLTGRLDARLAPVGE